jgi:hypothetical protein
MPVPRRSIIVALVMASVISAPSPSSALSIEEMKSYSGGNLCPPMPAHIDPIGGDQCRKICPSNSDDCIGASTECWKQLDADNKTIGAYDSWLESHCLSGGSANGSPPTKPVPNRESASPAPPNSVPNSTLGEHNPGPSRDPSTWHNPLTSEELRLAGDMTMERHPDWKAQMERGEVLFREWPSMSPQQQCNALKNEHSALGWYMRFQLTFRENKRPSDYFNHWLETSVGHCYFKY